jgi:hypothetical protein
MKALQNQKVTWKNVPTRTITAGGVEFAYRELGTDNPGTPVVVLIQPGCRPGQLGSSSC